MAGEAAAIDRLVLDVVGSVDSAARRMPSFLDSIGRTAAAAVTGLAALTAWSAQTADDLIKTARSASTTVEAFSALSIQAELAGASNMDLITASRSMSRALFTAAQGSKQQAEAFALLGINAKEALESERDFASLLPDIIDGLNGIESSQQRTAVGQLILGRGFSNLASLIANGGDALRQNAQVVEQWGLVVGTDAAVASEALNDSMARLRMRFRGLALELGLRMVPAALRVSEAFETALDAARPRVVEAMSSAVEELRRRFEALPEPVQKAIVALTGLTAAGGIAAGFRSLIKSAANLPFIGTALRTIGTRALAVGGTVGGIIALGLAIDDLNHFMADSPSLTGEWADSMGVDSELYVALSSLGDLADVTGELFGMAMTAIGDGAAYVGTAAVDSLDSFATWIEETSPLTAQRIRSIGDALEYVGESFSFIGDAFASPEVFLRNLGRGAAVATAGLQQLTAGRRGELPSDIAGTAVRRMQELEAERAAMRAANGNTVQAPVNINVNGAQDPATVAREVDRQLQRHLQSTVELNRG